MVRPLNARGSQKDRNSAVVKHIVSAKNADGMLTVIQNWTEGDEP